MGQDQGVGSGLGGGGGFDRERMNRLKAVLTLANLPVFIHPTNVLGFSRALLPLVRYSCTFSICSSSSAAASDKGSRLVDSGVSQAKEGKKCHVAEEGEAPAPAAPGGGRKHNIMKSLIYTSKPLIRSKH